MATFPTTIPVDVGTREPRDLGTNMIVMEDGTPHVQGFQSTAVEWVDYEIHNNALTQAERDSAYNFLRDNRHLEFDFANPADSATYRGRLADPRVEQQRIGDYWNLRWRYRAKKL